LIVMPGNEKHHEQVAADGNEEKGIVRNGKQDEPEHAKLKEKVQKVADRWIHVLFSAFVAIASVVPTWRKGVFAADERRFTRIRQA
jgi:hypothetical protein